MRVTEETISNTIVCFVSLRAFYEMKLTGVVLSLSRPIRLWIRSDIRFGARASNRSNHPPEKARTLDKRTICSGKART
jgi:hypothetical protein